MSSSARQFLSPWVRELVRLWVPKFISTQGRQFFGSADIPAAARNNDNLVLSTGLIIWIGRRKEIRKLTFRALALPPSESIRSDEGLTLETSTSESLCGGQFTLSTQLIKPNYLVILPTDAAPQFLWKLAPFIHSKLPCICLVKDHRWCQNVVRTSVTHSAIASGTVFLFLPHFAVIYFLYWTDAGQHGIYLVTTSNKQVLFPLGLTRIFFTRLYINRARGFVTWNN